MVPSSGRWTPYRIFISVDLPAPFSPTTACTGADPDVHVDVVVGDHAGEALADAAQPYGELRGRRLRAGCHGGADRRPGRYGFLGTVISPATTACLAASSWSLMSSTNPPLVA